MHVWLLGVMTLIQLPKQNKGQYDWPGNSFLFLHRNKRLILQNQWHKGEIETCHTLKKYLCTSKKKVYIVTWLQRDPLTEQRAPQCGQLVHKLIIG
jgi:hypothetical protein